MSHPEKRDAYDNERRRQAEQDTAKPTGQGGPEATASPSNSPTRDRPTSTETKRPDNNGPSTKTKQQGCGCALAFLAFFAGLIAIGSIQSDPAPDNAIDDGATDPMAIAPESAPEAPITTSQEETVAAADLMTFAFTSRQKALVEQYRNEDDECRGGGGGAAKIQHHCAVRNAMDYVMDEAGLCYGKKYDVTMADMEWHLCTNDSNRITSKAVTSNCTFSVRNKVVYKGSCIIDADGGDFSALSSDYAIHVGFDSYNGQTYGTFHSWRPDMRISEETDNVRLTRQSGRGDCGGNELFEACFKD